MNPIVRIEARSADDLPSSWVAALRALNMVRGLCS